MSRKRKRRSLWDDFDEVAALRLGVPWDEDRPWVKSAREQAEIRQIAVEVKARDDARIVRERVLQIRAKKGGEVARKEQVRPAPTAQHLDATLFALYCGARIMHLRHIPRPLFELMDDYPAYTGSWYSDLKAGRATIHLSTALSVTETVSLTLHEFKHTTHDEWSGPKGYLERKQWEEDQAREFQRTWTYPVIRAGLATKWDQDRVRIMDQTRPPHKKSEGDAGGDVAISRDSPGNVFICRNGSWRFLGDHP